MENLSPDDRAVIGRIKADDGVSFEEVSDDVMRKMADTQTPQGVLAIVKEKRWELADLLSGGSDFAGKDDAESSPANADKAEPLLLILENIQDPGNLGNMFRSGEGAGVTGIIMSSDTADVYNPKVVRSTIGAIFRVPFLYVDSIPEFTRKLHDEHGINCYAAHLKGKQSYDKLDYKKGTAFLIGNEGNGLTKEAADAA